MLILIQQRVTPLDSRTRLQFEFIEMLLAYEGEITNQRLRERFGVTSVQASRVLASYRDAFPSNTQALKGQGRGRYIPTARFKPEIANLSIEAYFRSVKDQIAHVTMEETQRDFTNVDPALFRVIRLAMDHRAASRIIYRSMNNPDGIERIIHPLAFVFAGRRWHVRGFDELTEQHRDFNLARISSAESSPKSLETPMDIDWEEKVQLELRPHPALNAGQEKLIRDELFKGAIGRRITTRRALVRYVLRDLEVAENPESQHPPEFQVYLFRTEFLQE